MLPGVRAFLPPSCLPGSAACGHAAVEADEDVVAASRVRELEKRVRDLERMLGRKTMENEILKEAIDVARPKNRPCPWCPGTILRTVPDERRCQNPGRRPFQPYRARRYARGLAWPLSQAGGRRAAGQDQADHQQASNLWLSPGHRADQPRTPARGQACRQPQAGVARHAPASPDPATPHGSTSRANS